ncbi:Transposase (probable), IS891/IS1136/IS1341 domain protein, partial [mine drainage metagenome]
MDLGLSHLATLSTGEVVDPPRFLRRAEKRLRRAQRVVTRRRKGSHRREKARVRLARCHATVRDQRRDLAHKVTTGWAERHDLIAFEDMDVRRLMTGRFPRAMADAGWG